MSTVVVGVVLPLLSRDRPFGNAQEGREERPSPTVANVRDEESRLLSWGSLLLRSRVLDILV